MDSKSMHYILDTNILIHLIRARNMGKNDLWIAATTHLLNATLVTTDHDFDHLDPSFIQLHKIMV
jgi:predicted nucleic acid-binding protein